MPNRSLRHIDVERDVSVEDLGVWDGVRRRDVPGQLGSRCAGVRGASRPVQDRVGAAAQLALQVGRQYREHPAPPGVKRFSFTAKRIDLPPERLSGVHRVLVKQALESAWLDLGEDRMLSAEFDRERDVVLRGGHRGCISTPQKMEFGELSTAGS